MVQSELKLSYQKHILSPALSDSKDAYIFLKDVWDKDLIDIQEQVYIIFMNDANQVIAWRCINTGTINNTLFDIKIAVAAALISLATKVIVAHNHTSGDTQPSKSDIFISNKLFRAFALFDIVLLDHLVLSDNKYFSFVDNRLKFE